MSITEKMQGGWPEFMLQVNMARAELDKEIAQQAIKIIREDRSDLAWKFVENLDFLSEHLCQRCETQYEVKPA